MWSAGAVARRLGIAPTTLRSWHQRYGLEPATPPPRRHRRYREQDIAVLERMAQLVAQGVVPAAAAQIARVQPDTPPGPPQRRREPGDNQSERITAQAVRGLVLAALRLDAQTLQHVLDDAFATNGIEQTWQQLCVPTLDALGRRVTPTGGCIDAILLLSWTITTSLHRATGPRRPHNRSRRALLACPAGERHSLGLEVLHAVLTVHGIDVNMLGAAVPIPVLLAAADRLRPAAVVVWSQMPRTARPTLLRNLTTLAAATIAAGPGWRHTRLPAGVLHVTNLQQAITTISQATTSL